MPRWQATRAPGYCDQQEDATLAHKQTKPSKKKIAEAICTARNVCSSDTGTGMLRKSSVGGLSPNGTIHHIAIARQTPKLKTAAQAVALATPPL